MFACVSLIIRYIALGLRVFKHFSVTFKPVTAKHTNTNENKRTEGEKRLRGTAHSHKKETLYFDFV